MLAVTLPSLAVIFLTFSGPCKSQIIPSQSSFLATLLNTTVEAVESVVENFNFLDIPKKNLQFFLYPQNSNETITLDSSNFIDLINPEYPTKIIIHGWTNNGKEPWIKEMASLYHQTGKFNVIAVDWEPVADKRYIYSSTITRSVGKIVADYIVEIKEKFPNFLKTLHLIGHSLGGQVSGFTGKRVLDKSSEPIDRITGLDPAAPLFETPIQRPFNLFLTKSDATFVDLIHTNVGMYGVLGQYGNMDFYPDNGGPVQKQCLSLSPSDMLSCSHHAAHVYFSQTIVEPKKYEAVACKNRIRYSLGICSRNQKAYMGDKVSRDGSDGVYYLTVQ